MRPLQIGLMAFKLVGVPLLLSLVVAEIVRRSFDQGLGFDWRPVVLAVILYQAALFLSGLRVSQLLSIFGGRLGSVAAFRINLEALFYFLVVPIGVGVEAVRFLKIREAAPKVTASAVVTVLLLDRLIGAVAAILLFAVSVPFVTVRALPQIGVDMQVLLLIALLVCLSVLALIFLRKWGTHIEEILRTVLSSWFRIGWIALLAVVIHLLTVLAVFAAARGLGLEITLAQTAWGVLGGIVLMLVPVSLAGIGAAEIGGAALLLAVGVEAQVALMVVFIAYLGRVMGGVQGAILEILDGGRMMRTMLSGRRPPGVTANTDLRP